jgi:hypothetical protein
MTPLGTGTKTTSETQTEENKRLLYLAQQLGTQQELIQSNTKQSSTPPSKHPSRTCDFPQKDPTLVRDRYGTPVRPVLAGKPQVRENKALKAQTARA